MPRREVLLIAAVLLLPCQPAFGQRLVFLGEPTIKVTLDQGKPEVTVLSPEQTKEFQCRILKEGDKYFWESRKNTEVVPVDYPGYRLYVAVDGTGYVKVRKGELAKLLSIQQ